VESFIVQFLLPKIDFISWRIARTRPSLCSTSVRGIAYGLFTMSFRRKHIVVGGPVGRDTATLSQERASFSPGIRLSPLDGRLTTSTGTSSLDNVLGRHLGLPLGNSLLVEEVGTTEFSGALLRYYASEGLVQGHCVHVLGVTEAWRGELPGLSRTTTTAHTDSAPTAGDKMKIAWRYEYLRNRGAVSKGTW
jgi:elongator complex protein 4